MTDIKKAWLPNLVGGVSVWKLAPDLNAKNFMDGRLLVPETEGAESLPTEVRWNVDGLVPLAQAQRDDAAGVQRAVADFQSTLGSVEKTLAAEGSGYERFREAFTMPTIDAAGEDQYFYDPRTQQLRVKNWGASPRELAGGKEAVFGLGRLGVALAGVAVPSPSSAAWLPQGQRSPRRRQQLQPRRSTLRLRPRPSRSHQSRKRRKPRGRSSPRWWPASWCSRSCCCS